MSEARTGASRTTPTGLGVAVVSLARFLQAREPTLTSYLVESLRGAEAAGLASADLEFMRLLIRATTSVSRDQ